MRLLRNKIKGPSTLLLFMCLSALIGLLLFILSAFTISMFYPLSTLGQMMLMTLIGACSGGITSALVERIVYDWRKEHWKSIPKGGVQFKRDTDKYYNELMQGKHK